MLPRTAVSHGEGGDLGLPLFGVYEWDVILHGYQNASLEKDARDHGGF